jgi:hypothetical protein
MILAKIPRPVVSMLGDVMNKTPSMPGRRRPPRRKRALHPEPEHADRAARTARVQPARRWTPSRMLGVGGIGLSLLLAGCGGAAAGSSSGTSSTKTASPAVTPTIAAQAPKATAPSTTVSPQPTGSAKAPAAGTSTTVKAPPAPSVAAAKPANPDAGIPQGGGDGDPDNAGGPNDGDGAI